MLKQTHLLFLLLFLIGIINGNAVFSQKKTATISGIVITADEKPLAKVSITILGKQSVATITNDSGKFNITVPSGRAFALVFSSVGFKNKQQNFNLSPDENETVTVEMERGENELENVTVRNTQERTETGLIKINPKYVINNPSPIQGVESMIKLLVGSGNELTSQYNVRGGSFDENLVYVNDFEIFRPYLIRSGQQEGLSFINPEMTGNINFYNGGFQAKYGDKMSSVLDITYKKPTRFGGSGYIGLLEQGLHFEGISKDSSITYQLGVRNRSLRNLLASQETKGNYIPSSADAQAYITWQANSKWFLEFLGNASGTHFTFFPRRKQANYLRFFAIIFSKFRPRCFF